MVTAQEPQISFTFQASLFVLTSADLPNVYLESPSVPRIMQISVYPFGTKVCTNFNESVKLAIIFIQALTLASGLGQQKSPAPQCRGIDSTILLGMSNKLPRS